MVTRRTKNIRKINYLSYYMSRGSTPKKDILETVLKLRKLLNKLTKAKRKAKYNIAFVNTRSIYDRDFGFELPPGVTWQLIRSNIEEHLRLLEHQIVDVKFIYRKEHKRLATSAA